MKVFLSWSGKLSLTIAEQLKEWLPSVLQTLEPFISNDSIEKGSRWSADLSDGLRSSAFGIICLTRENLNSPWMTFEAGALSEGLSKARVCPLLVDIEEREIQGPLAAFQATRLEREDFKKLLSSLNTASGDASVEASRLERLFDALWPELESSINTALAASADANGPGTPEALSTRTFRLLAGRGTLINPSDESRNIAFKVETINRILASVSAALEAATDTVTAQAAFETAGYEAALLFGERIYERWGLEYPDDTLTQRIERWCAFDSDVGWGRLVSELELDEATDQVCGNIRLLDNFQTYKRSTPEYPDCHLMHGYVRGALEALTDGTPLRVECEPAECPLLNRRKRDCVFKVTSIEAD